MNAPWIKIPSVEFQRHKEGSRGSSVFYPSPFEIPDAFRNILDETSGDIIIEFRYIDSSEPTRDCTHSNGIKIKLGRSSSRLFEIRVPAAMVKNAIAEATKNRPAIEAIQQLSSEPSLSLGQRRRDNYRVAQQMLEKQELQPAG